MIRMYRSLSLGFPAVARKSHSGLAKCRLHFHYDLSVIRESSTTTALIIAKTD